MVFFKKQNDYKSAKIREELFTEGKIFFNMTNEEWIIFKKKFCEESKTKMARNSSMSNVLLISINYVY